MIARETMASGPGASPCWLLGLLTALAVLRPDGTAGAAGNRKAG